MVPGSVPIRPRVPCGQVAVRRGARWMSPSVCDAMTAAVFVLTVTLLVAVEAEHERQVRGQRRCNRGAASGWVSVSRPPGSRRRPPWGSDARCRPGVVPMGSLRAALSDWVRQCAGRHISPRCP